MIEDLKKFTNLRVSHLLQKEGHRRALLCTTCEVDSALQLLVTGLSALIFPVSQNQWNSHWIPNASILPEPLMIPQYFSTPQMYVGQDWELQWSYMVKCEFQPHCSKHFRAQRIHTQHPRKQAPLFFFGGPVRTWWRTHFGLHLSTNWPEQWRWNQCSFTYGETLRKWCVQASHEFPGSCNSKRRSGRYFKEIFSGNWSSKPDKTLEKQIPQVWLVFGGVYSDFDPNDPYIFLAIQKIMVLVNQLVVLRIATISNSIFNTIL